jgi:hypothetical protein
MRAIHRLTLVLAAAALFMASPAPACPNCKEAASAAIDEGGDPLREARAYNHSIYFMLAVPYTIAGVFGVYVYRHLRRQPMPDQA